MLEKYKRKRLQKATEKALLQDIKNSKSSKIKTVGLLFNGDDALDASFSIKLLKALQISEEKASALTFVTFQKKIPSLTQEQCSNKDFSWNGTIVATHINTFIQQEFDLLVCYYEGQHDYLDVITAKSKAHFKVGFSSKRDAFFDLMIDVDAKDTVGFIAELKKYITILGKL